MDREPTLSRLPISRLMAVADWVAGLSNDQGAVQPDGAADRNSLEAALVDAEVMAGGAVPSVLSWLGTDGTRCDAVVHHTDGREGTEGIETVGEMPQERPLPTDWPQRRARCLRRDAKTCQRCRRTLTARQLVVHYVVPRTEGGSDAPDNLISLCKIGRPENGDVTCHAWVEQRTSRGRLATTREAIQQSSWDAPLLAGDVANAA
jgi:hypothetical protein